MTMAGTLTLQLSIVLAVGFLLPGSESYSFHFGSCPDVKPVANFDIKKVSFFYSNCITGRCSGTNCNGTEPQGDQAN